MGKNMHDKHLDQSGRSNPPAGRNFGSADHALQAGHDGATQRKNVAPHREAHSRDAGRDDRRSGSDHGKH